MNLLKNHIIQFIIMLIVGMAFNPMNMLAYRLNDIYFSLTLFYGGLLMASNMIWAHEIIHYLNMSHFNITVFIIGICASLASVYLLRQQLFVNDHQWLRRMIGHHSTALTTTHKIIKKSNNPTVIKLSTEIINAQEKEITLMKSLVHT